MINSGTFLLTKKTDKRLKSPQKACQTGTCSMIGRTLQLIVTISGKKAEAATLN